MLPRAGPLARDLQIDPHRGDMNVGCFVALAGRVEARQQESAYQFGRRLNAEDEFTDAAFAGASLHGKPQQGLDNSLLRFGQIRAGRGPRR